MKHLTQTPRSGRRWNLWLAWQVFRGKVYSIELKQDAYKTLVTVQVVV